MDRFFVLPKTKFDLFFNKLVSTGKLYAPVAVSEKSYSFKSVIRPDEIAWQALRTILPPKKYFFKETETILTYKDNEIKEVLPESTNFSILGLHPCDLASLSIMDKIFLDYPSDTHYAIRRKNAFLIGTSCMPDEHCFCESMGTSSVNNTYDIFLTDILDKYFIEVATAKGKEFLDSLGDSVHKSDSSDESQYKTFWREREKSFKIGFKEPNLKSLMNLEIDNPIWEELGNQCLSCGNCTPVCPTCYCFDMLDTVNLDSVSGQRDRQWDSCQFTMFASVAGDFNFRASPVERLKFWYRHKLHGFEDPYGLKTCVGCGRCTVSCPAEIDDIVGLVKVLQNSSP